MSDLAGRLAQLSDEQRAALVRKLKSGAARAGIVARARTDDDVALSFTQQRLWFLEQFAPGLPLHSMSGVARIPVPIPPTVIADCLDEVVRRHEILRTAFVMRGGEPVGVVADAVEVPITVLGDLSTTDRERHFAADARRPFNLAAAPLLRLTVASGESECFVQLTMHHLVSDGFSNLVFFGELGTLIQAHFAGVPAELAQLPFQFSDVAEWERARAESPGQAGRLDHWVERLTGAPPHLALPADHPRPARMTHRGSRLPVDLPGDVVTALRALGAEHGVTAFQTLLAAYVIVLGRYGAQDDVVVGVPVANREESGTDRLIGPFLNTLALRVGLDDDPTFAQLLSRVRAIVLDGFQHQEVPFERVLSAVRAVRDPSRTPLFQAMLNVHADQSASAGATPIELRDLHNGCAQFDLLLNLVVDGEGIRGHADYYADAYAPATVQRLLDSLIAVLRGAITDPDRAVSELPLLAPEPSAAVLAACAPAPTPYDHGATVHDLVLAAARTHPDRIAIVGDGSELSYRELDARSAALAAALADLSPGAHVALCLPRSPDMIVAILAVLRAGLTYVPLDPGYPAERRAFICADAGIAALVTRSDQLDEVSPVQGVPTVLIDRLSMTDRRVTRAVAPEAVAYAIYTSGSTGLPKGVRVSHRSVVNFLDSMRAEPGLAADDVLLAVTSPSFDIAVLEMLLPLTAGARVVVAPAAVTVDGRRLAAMLETHGITVMQATPSSWQLMVGSGWSGRRALRALCGGEAFPPALAGELLRRCGEVWNMYGPTETTIWSTVHRVTAQDVATATIPIGHPIANTSAYVLDAGGSPVPPGVLGELYLGGDGVTIGYHDRPELTAERFVAAPFGSGERLYRTGDLARRRVDGTLECAGRIDHQVKLRGYRIELGEIEVTLESHPAVARAVAVVHGEIGIVAYVEAAGEIESLRAHLTGRLPEYMIPGRIVALEALPLTPNGKLDRRALPVPSDDHGSAAGAERVAPSTDAERALATIWQELLEISDVGVHDGFFELGGHSLLATKLVFQIREAFGIDLPLQLMFEGEPTIARLAEALTSPAAQNPDGALAELDLAAEAVLAEEIRPQPGTHVHSVRHPQHPFVTGATGFVGAFLLAELLADTEATAFCLVRAASAQEGYARIRSSLADYGIWREEFAERIIPVVGSLSRPKLGLGRPEWQHLAAMIDVIYHCGAEVNFLQPYQSLRPANVGGTEEVLRLACTGATKPVHFVSTTFVFSRFAYPPGTEFTEQMHPIHDLEYTYGYTQSKWVSEQMVLEAGRRGVPVYVYRAGRVAGHSTTGACQTYDFVWQATKVGIELGAAPVMEMVVDITPVDYVVEAMLHLSRQPDLRGQIFHVVSDAPISEPDLVAWMEQYGYTGDRLGFDQWCDRVIEHATELPDTTAGALAPLLSRRLPLDRIPAARFDRSNVERGLVGSGIDCPQIDDQLLRTYFDYFTRAGYIPDPAAALAARDAA